jgi:diketogulonate reductase-like aldo/keto reductase
MMERRAWGPTGVEVPVIGQGTWQMEEDGRAQCVRAIRAGLDAGLTHIDTAELYGRGEVEDIVGEAIEGRRDEVFLVSKVLPSNASREGTLEACERSLRALRTDHLDSYLLHWPGPHPLEETIAAFEELVQGGKIRSWGVSNFDVEAMEDALRIAGEGKIACNQVLYHVEERTIEHEVLPFCEAHGIALVGYSPYGSGRFPDDDPTLLRIAAAHGATPYQVALAFLTRHPSTFTIPKAARAEHAVENARVVHLGEDELAAIDQAFPLGRSRRLPTL